LEHNIKFAIIGLGFVGKRHAAMIQRHPEAELVGFCDLLSREDLGLESFGDIPLYQNLDELLQLDFEVLCICTPNGLHAQHAIQGLEAKKHVVVEKPMALTKADCEKVIYKSLNVSRNVFVVMQNRYSPPSVWIKEVIDQQLLGDICMVQINCYWNRDDRYYFKNGEKHPWKGTKDLDGGTLFTQFSHFIDIMYWLFGDITNIQAKFKDFQHQHSTEFEDSGLVSFDFVNGGMGCINYSTAVYQQNMESSLTIIGSKGSVKIGGQYMNELEYCNIENYEMPELPEANPANDYGAYKGSAANHVYLIENVVDVLKGRKSITTNALEGLKVVEIIEKIYALK
jgi:UDP-N-acetyl-2-amino-2-deoxyglucuronate dehydrogenase